MSEKMIAKTTMAAATNASGYWDKYMLQSGQIYFAKWTNTVCYMDKYNCKLGQIPILYQMKGGEGGSPFCIMSVTNFAIWTNSSCYLDKHTLQSGQIHTFCKVDKYIGLYGQIYLAIWRNTMNLSIEGWCGREPILQCIMSLAQICAIWTSASCYLDKYI